MIMKSLVFVLMFGLPFIIQLFTTNNDTRVMKCLIVCLISKIIQFLENMVSFVHQGKEFFRSLQNLFVILDFVLYIIYFSYRVRIRSVLPYENGEVSTMFGWSVFNTYMILSMSLTIWQGLQVFESFNRLLKLLKIVAR